MNTASTFNWKDFPELKWEPTEKQVEAVKVLSHRQKFLLADTTGLGKTYATLASYASVRSRYPGAHLLVLATKSAVVSWKKDITKGTSFTVEELGVECREKDEWPVQADITLLTYSALCKFKNYVVNALNTRKVVLVLDEAHRVKNPKAKITPWIHKISKHVLCFWMLTATPVTNHLIDLFHLVDLLVPGYLGAEEYFKRTYLIRKERLIPSYLGEPGRFRRRYIGGRVFKVINEVVGHKNLDKLQEKLVPILLRRDQELNVRFLIDSVPLTQEEDQMYLVAAAGLLGETYKDFTQRLPDLQLTANNAVDLQRNPNKSSSIASKEVKMLDRVKEELDKNNPVLLFTTSLVTKERLVRLLKRHLIFNFRDLYEIDGTSSKKHREKVATKFGRKDVLVVSQAGGESLNLQAAARIVFYDLPFDMKMFAQAVGRVARMDTDHEVIEVVVIEAKGTIDTYKVAMLASNVETFRQVLAGTSTLPKSCRKVSKADLQKYRKDLLWRTKDLRS